jgi:hypothetical protein
MICTRPPKKNAAGSTMGTPALFSRPLWYMPSMNDVVANAVTAHAAGSAIPAGEAGVTCRSSAAFCPIASDAVIVPLPCVAAARPRLLRGRGLAIPVVSLACGRSLPSPPPAQERGPSARGPDGDALAAHEAADGHGGLAGEQLDMV